MSNILRESARGIDLIPLTDELLSKNQVFLTGTINEENCNNVIKQLMYLNSKSDVEDITLFINSAGGSVIAGMALYDVIRMMTKPIRTVVVGQACSMAAIIYLAADKRLMLPSSRLMIHDPSYGGEHNVAGLKSHEIQIELDELNKCRAKLASIIAERTGKNIKEVYKATKTDSFYDVEEAVKFGLASGVFDICERGET